MCLLSPESPFNWYSFALYFSLFFQGRNQKFFERKKFSCLKMLLCSPRRGRKRKVCKGSTCGQTLTPLVEEPLGRNSRNSQGEDWITSRCWVPEMRISSTLSPLLQSLCFIYVFKPISQVILIHTYHSMRTKTKYCILNSNALPKGHIPGWTG